MDVEIRFQKSLMSLIKKYMERIKMCPLFQFFEQYHEVELFLTRKILGVFPLFITAWVEQWTCLLKFHDRKVLKSRIIKIHGIQLDLIAINIYKNYHQEGTYLYPKNVYGVIRNIGHFECIKTLIFKLIIAYFNIILLYYNSHKAEIDININMNHVITYVNWGNHHVKMVHHERWFMI